MGNSIYFTERVHPGAELLVGGLHRRRHLGPSPNVANARKRTFFANWGTSLEQGDVSTSSPLEVR